MKKEIYICDTCGTHNTSAVYSMKCVSGKGLLDLNIRSLDKLEDRGFHFCGLTCLIQKINKSIENINKE